MSRLFTRRRHECKRLSIIDDLIYNITKQPVFGWSRYVPMERLWMKQYYVSDSRDTRYLYLFIARVRDLQVERLNNKRSSYLLNVL